MKKLALIALLSLLTQTSFAASKCQLEIFDVSLVGVEEDAEPMLIDHDARDVSQLNDLFLHSKNVQKEGAQIIAFAAFDEGKITDMSLTDEINHVVIPATISADGKLATVSYSTNRDPIFGMEIDTEVKATCQLD